MARGVPRRHAVRGAADESGAGVRAAGGADAGAGDRRQQRDLCAGRRHAAPAAPVHRAGSADGGLGTAERHAPNRRQPGRLRRLERGHPHLRVDGRLPAEPPRAHRRGRRRRERARAGGHAPLLRRPRREANRRPHVRPRRRNRCAHLRRPQRSLLAVPLRRGPDARRTPDQDRRCDVHGHRRRPGRLQPRRRGHPRPQSTVDAAHQSPGTRPRAALCALPPGDRPAQARRGAGGGGGRPERDRRIACEGTGHEPGPQRDDRAAARGVRDARAAPDVDPPRRRCRVPAADVLRERSQPAAGAHRGARARAGRALGARRRASAHRPPDAGRRPGAGRARWGGRRLCRSRNSAGCPFVDSRGVAARCRIDRVRCARAGLLRGDLAGSRCRVRSRPGVAGDGRLARAGRHTRRPGRDATRLEIPKRAGNRTGRRRGAAVVRGGAAAAHARHARAGRSRPSRPERADDDRQPRDGKESRVHASVLRGCRAGGQGRPGRARRGLGNRPAVRRTVVHRRASTSWAIPCGHQRSA